MSITYQIKHQVKTIGESWLHVLHENQSLRSLELIYDGLVKNNPDDYFELVMVEHKETALNWSKKK